MKFGDKLENISNKNNSLLCVGLDIDSEKIPKFLFNESKKPFLDFNKKIIDETKDLVCAYKLNMAFYEALGENGLSTLKETINHIPKEILIILDGKRNDIGNTANKYAQSLFDGLKADAITINPYLGEDGITPFLKYEEKCSFILCRTSNPSAGDFQDLKISDKKLYEHVAMKIKKWNTQYQNCGAVVGATYPDELKTIRKILGEDIPLLIPGIGKQGGDIQKTIKYGTNAKGEMAIINSSRGIIYSSNDKDFYIKARESAEELNKKINSFR